jgi:hypothetical protein
MNYRLKNLIGIFIVLLAFTACENDTSHPAHLKVRLTDAPIDFDAVLVDITGVNILYSLEDTMMADTLVSEWIELNTFTGMYNLLELQDGVDTMLVTDDIPSGVLKEIRLVLSEDNYVVVEGDTMPLTIPSGQSSGLKVKVNQIIEPGADVDMLLDFDAEASVHVTGNGKYMMRPVVRLEYVDIE